MNASPLPHPPSNRTAPLVLWRIAGAFMHALYMLFGGPEDVARHGSYAKHNYRRMLAWLRVAEALLRRLLLIEANAIAYAYTPPDRTPPRQRARKLREFSADKPEEWRVSFRCFSSRASVGSGSRHSRETLGGVGAGARFAIASTRKRAKRIPKRFFNTWPLAERYEAALRVFNNPAAFARRLAKRLYAQPHRRREVMRASADARHKIGDEAWARIAMHCDGARRLSDSS